MIQTINIIIERILVQEIYTREQYVERQLTNFYNYLTDLIPANTSMKHFKDCRCHTFNSALFV
jgi:hypothetical protein